MIFHSNLIAFFFICKILSIWFHQCDCDQISLRLQCDKNLFIVFEIHFELKLQFMFDCLLHKLKNLITDHSKIVENESFDQQFLAEPRSVLRNFRFDRKFRLREKNNENVKIIFNNYLIRHDVAEFWWKMIKMKFWMIKKTWFV